MTKIHAYETHFTDEGGNIQKAHIETKSVLSDFKGKLLSRVFLECLYLNVSNLCDNLNSG